MRVKGSRGVGKWKLGKLVRKIEGARKFRIDVLVVLLLLHELNWECDLKHSPRPVSHKKLKQSEEMQSTVSS